MFKLHKLCLVASLASSLALTSCSTVGDPQVTQARNGVFQTRKTYLQGAAAGAALGAGLGAGVGAIVGNQSRQAGAGALIGAAAGAGVGALGGLLYAQHVVNQRRAYADAGAYLEACTLIASEQHASISKYNKALASRREQILANEKLLKTELAGAEKVRSRLREEIELQDAALRQARAEKVNPARINAQQLQLSRLKADDRNLTAEIDRLTAFEDEEEVLLGSR